jgi:hypothetical protein
VGPFLAHGYKKEKTFVDPAQLSNEQGIRLVWDLVFVDGGGGGCKENELELEEFDAFDAVALFWGGHLIHFQQSIQFARWAIGGHKWPFHYISQRMRPVCRHVPDLRDIDMYYQIIEG